MGRARQPPAIHCVRLCAGTKRPLLRRASRFVRPNREELFPATSPARSSGRRHSFPLPGDLLRALGPAPVQKPRSSSSSCQAAPSWSAWRACAAAVATRKRRKRNAGACSHRADDANLSAFVRLARWKFARARPRRDQQAASPVVSLEFAAATAFKVSCTWPDMGWRGARGADLGPLAFSSMRPVQRAPRETPARRLGLCLVLCCAVLCCPPPPPPPTCGSFRETAPRRPHS